MLALVNGDVYTPGRLLRRGTVLVADGRIAAIERPGVEPPLSARVFDLRGLRVLPGFIDLHVHGAEGQDTLECGTDGCAQLAASLARHGVTGFLPTLASQPLPAMAAALERWSTHQRGDGARVLGVHLEGPYLSPAMPGAMDPESFVRFNRRSWDRLWRASAGGVRLATIAVEYPEHVKAIATLQERGVLASAGHTAATFEQFTGAVQRGLSHATHTFNAMSPLHHRNPGTTGGVLLHDQVVAQVIADGCHVHPAALALLFKIKGADRVAVITDAAAPTGLPPGEWTWAGRRVISDGQTVRLPGGTLAGSLLTMERALRNLVELAGIPFAAAVEATSGTPARALGLHQQTGSLRRGLDADVIALDEDYCVRLTVVAGRVVHDCLSSG